MLLWSIVLLILGLALIVLEVFVPSGGALGMLAALSLIAAVGLGFFVGPLVGLAALGVVVVGVPALIAAGLRVWPTTPIGRRILLDVPTEEDVRPDHEQLVQLKQLVGQVGVAKTTMLPSGAISVGGRAIDAISQGIAIEPGQRVQVVEVRGMRVFVRPVDESIPLTPEKPVSESESDPLQRPIESLIEDFEDPLLGNQA